MFTYSIMKPEGILLLRPSTPLSKADFGGLSADVDAYLSEHAKLRVVMVQAKGFPGWEDFSGFTAHMHFVREHHNQVRRIAVVTDGPPGRHGRTAGQALYIGRVQTFCFFRRLHGAGVAESCLNSVCS